MLEKLVASLENGKYASCFGAGVAAISMVVNLLTVGDNILCIDDVYGGTHEYFDRVAVNNGITVTYADLTNVDNVNKNMNENTKVKILCSFVFFSPIFVTRSELLIEHFYKFLRIVKYNWIRIRFFVLKIYLSEFVLTPYYNHYLK